MKTKAAFVVSLLFVSSVLLAQTYPYQDKNLDFHSRAKDLVSRLTLEEKISQVGHRTPAVKRGEVNLPAYNYWSEGLHGVARSGLATSFPSSKAMSSTWDRQLIYDCAWATSDEARVYNNLHGKGLTYWCPTINMSRDPRWGRDEEDYGEDPFLTGELAVQYIRAMQGDDGKSHKYYKTVATAKHFAANNYERGRHNTSSDVSEKNLREYYFPAFEKAVKEANVRSVMSAYNELNGIPCGANYELLTKILREEWGFDGFVTSDCGAIDDIYRKHKWVETAAEASGRAMAAGEDLNCGSTFQSACKEAIQRGFLTEAQLDTALVRVLEARFSLGEFDDKSDVEWTQIDSSVLDSQAHRDLALKAARGAIVLLKNDGILPLSKKLGKIAVIGPLADTMNLGGYSGSPVDTSTIVEGIAGKLGVNSSQLLYVKGCAVNNHNETDINAAVLAAEKADVVILALGTNLKSSDEGRDRQSLALPGDQQKLLEEVYKANHNVVLLLQTCSSVDVNWAQEHVPAIVEAWYDGQAQGKAVADVLFGDFNPSGKLTSTWYASADDLPDDMLEYNIDEAGYTYMYLIKAPLYPFGYGLSYTSFEYSGLKISHSELEKGEAVEVSFDIRNIGDRSGAEIPQLYIHTNGRLGGQLKQLRGFDRIELQPGESKTVTFHLPYSALAHYDEDAHIWTVEQGNVDIMVGASSSDIRLRAGVVVKKGSSTVSPFLL